MELFDRLINYDKQLLLFLHAQGNPYWDGFWIFITTPSHWTPLFLYLFLLSYKAFRLKKALFIGLYTSVSVGIALLIVNVIKNFTQRLRPINDNSINTNIRILIEQNDFSFVSGHSTVSFTIAFLSYWVLRKKYTYSFLVFLFPILFTYSRIYLAVHFPFDILLGMLLGYLIALIFNVIIEKTVFKKGTI